MIQLLKAVLGIGGLGTVIVFGSLALLTPLDAAGPYWTNVLWGLGMMFGAAVLHQLSKPIGPR